MKLTLQIFSFIFILSAGSFAQTGRDSLTFSQQSYSERMLVNSLEKQINTYSLNTIAKYFISTENLFFGIRQNFNSTVVKSSASNVQDEQFLAALGQYRFSDLLKFGILFNDNFYKDDRQTAINKTSSLTSSLFAKFLPLKNIEITPFGGFTKNSQIGTTDNGYTYGGEANIDKFGLGDFELSSQMKFQNEDISPRKNTQRLVNFDVNSSFEENFNNTITAYYSEQRKDFYFTADPMTAAEFNITNNIQSRTESNYFLQDRIKFAQANSPFSLDMSGRVGWRDIFRNTRYISLSNIANSNYDTRINEFKLDFYSAADYTVEEINISFRFSYSEKNEKHQPYNTDLLNSIIRTEQEKLELQKNNTSQLANISILSRINLTRSDHITFSLFHRKLRYDTPSELNFDDRDELLSMGRIMYEKEFNPFFRIFVNLEGNLNKLAYIFAERSSNNNLRRIIKISSGGTFSSNGFTSSNSAEASANYTVFDYEELNPNYRSYSFRQFVLRDSTNFRFHRKFRLFISGYLKLSEQGDFRWAGFTSKPSRYLDEMYIEPKLFFEHRSLSLGLGFRYFSLSTFNFGSGTEKILASDYNSIGPVVEISYVADERINLKFYGWYEFIKTESELRREMSNLSFNVNYRF